MLDMAFYKGKRVLLTGHTGFKGTWMSTMLVNAGAELIGYSRCSKKKYDFFNMCGLKEQITHIVGDVRDLEHLKAVFTEMQPEIVIHMAAQPIVREGYTDPVYTYETNVMGTVNIMECVRLNPHVKSFLNVTTDKVYENKEWEWGYRENEPIDGYDPYSNSKSCSEIITHSYKRSFFENGKTALSTARAGNVIGGGDFAKDRIIPDCVRAAIYHKDIIVRNPCSIRPYQHVLEPIYAYLMIVAKQYENPELAGWYNIGPNDVDCFETGALVDMFISHWGGGVKRVDQWDGGPHEANFLKLDCSKMKHTFGWRPHWNLNIAIEKVVEWSKCWMNGSDVRKCMDMEIAEFLMG